MGGTAARDRGVLRLCVDRAGSAPARLCRRRFLRSPTAWNRLDPPWLHVEAADRPQELALGGSHRFSNYALIFRLEELGENQTRLRAETRATFPGLKGGVYRTLVITTRMHVLVTRRLLNTIKQRAERA